MNLRKLLYFTVLPCLVLFVLLLPASALYAASAETQERQDGFFELFDEAGKSLTMTVRNLIPGDGYISSDNRYYIIDRIDGDKVYAKYKETVTLPDVETAFEPQGSSSPGTAWLSQLFSSLTAQLRNKDTQKRGTIAIYATHSDESYVPTSGKASEEQGDILDVADFLGNELEELGYDAIVSKNSHLPRDGEAYLRSRRTAFDLIKQHRPGTIVDVHRDAVPAKVYNTNVKGKDMVKVRLVVGRQNQNREANLEYAKRIKSIADKQYPGLIEGIFDAKGNYNQDLSPKAILLEVGTHVTSESKAKAAAQLMARVLPAAAGLSGGARPEGRRGGAAKSPTRVSFGGSGTRSVLWILGIGIAVAVVLMLLNGERGKNVKGFFKNEFSNAMGVPDDEKNKKREKETKAKKAKDQDKGDS